jgi:hypothetical protein
VKILSQRGKQARRVYDGAAFEIKKENSNLKEASDVDLADYVAWRLHSTRCVNGHLFSYGIYP